MTVSQLMKETEGKAERFNKNQGLSNKRSKKRIRIVKKTKPKIININEIKIQEKGIKNLPFHANKVDSKLSLP